MKISFFLFIIFYSHILFSASSFKTVVPQWFAVLGNDDHKELRVLLNQEKRSTRFDIDAPRKDLNDSTFLCVAAEYDAHECITLLFEFNANPNAPIKDGYTPLNFMLGYNYKIEQETRRLLRAEGAVATEIKQSQITAALYQLELYTCNIL